MNGHEARSASDRYFEHVASGARHAAAALLDELHSAGTTLDVIVQDLIGPAQAEVGERWLRNEWTVAQEHAATAISAAALSRLVGTSVPVDLREAVAICCPEGEWHSFPAQMVADLLSQRGWQVHQLGASTPALGLGDYLAGRHVVALMLSCTLPGALLSAEWLIAEAHNVGVPVIAGGRAFGTEPSRAAALGADAWAPDASSADRVLHRWTAHRPTLAPIDRAHLDRIAALDADVPSLIEEVMTGERVDPTPGSTTPEPSREFVDLMLHAALGAVVAQEDDIFFDHVEWSSRYLSYRNGPPGAVPRLLRALAVAATHRPVLRRILLLGIDASTESA